MLDMNETKEQFEERYSRASHRPDIFKTHKISLPCDCEDGGGPTHWAAVPRDPELVRDHLKLYAPDGTPWPDEIPRPTG